jgi:hypothetical protein
MRKERPHDINITNNNEERQDCFEDDEKENREE